MGMSSGASNLFSLVWRTISSDCYAHVASVVRPFARSGEVRPMWCLAKAYRYGRGVRKRRNEAVRLCESALKRGSADAGNELFDILWSMDSNDVLDRMRSMARYYAVRGEGWAYRCLGLMHFYGRGFERSLNRALICMRIAAEKKTQMADEGLLDVLWEIGGEKADREAVDIALKYVDEGEGWAYRRLGLMHKYGRGVDRDVGKALECLRKAVDRGYVQANEDVFLLLWESRTDEAVEEMSRIVDDFTSRGERWAYRLKGMMYRHGVGIEKDLTNALECVRTAMEERTSAASADLYDILEEIGTEESVSEAAMLASKYASLNEPWAVNRLANALLSRKDLENEEEGLELHRRAISLGSNESARDLYDCAHFKKDDRLLREAIGILVAFAEKGDPDCMMRLGKMYWNGDGMPYNRAVSLRWMEAAASINQRCREEYRVLVGPLDGASLDDVRC